MQLCTVTSYPASPLPGMASSLSQLAMEVIFILQDVLPTYITFLHAFRTITVSYILLLLKVLRIYSTYTTLGFWRSHTVAPICESENNHISYPKMIEKTSALSERCFMENYLTNRKSIKKEAKMFGLRDH